MRSLRRQGTERGPSYGQWFGAPGADLALSGGAPFNVLDRRIGLEL